MTRSVGWGVVVGSSLLALAAPASSASAADLEVGSAIETVTVYPDGASVTRTAHVTFPAGQTALVLRGLGPTIDPGSVRVEGLSDAALSIASVDVRTAPGDPAATANPDIEKQVRALQEQREEATARQQALEARKKAIEAYGQASPEKLGPGAAPLPVEQWPAAWDAVSKGLAETGEALVKQAREIADLDRRIAALEQARPGGPRPGRPLRDLVVTVDSAAPATGDLRITYRVAGASWQPVYDAKLETGSKEAKPSLTLVRRARISQRTGEDWSNVALAVSTVRASRGTAAPDPQSLLVGLYEPPVLYESAMPRTAAAPPAPQAADAQNAGEMLARKAAPAREQVAELESGGFQATFRVPGPVSIAPDGTPRTLALSSRSSEPVLDVRTVPAQDETAYLQAAFVNDEDAPLLPGEVMLSRDGTYVGKGRFKLVPPGDRVELGFGADDKVKVSRVPVKKKETEPGWVGNTRTDLREFKTTVRNLHAQPLRITVLDALPVSEHASVVVEQLPATTPPTEKAVADKRGVMAWTWDYLPGEQKEIRMAYRLKWPADRDLAFHPQRPVPASQ